MIFTFLTPALALSFLDAVTASLVPRKIDGGGNLRKTLTRVHVELTTLTGAGVYQWVTLSQFDESECDKGRNITVSTDAAKFNLIIAGKCEDCDGIEVSPDIWTYLNANHSATSETAIISNGTWCPS